MLISAAKLHIVFVELNLGAKKVLFLYLSVLLFCLLFLALDKHETISVFSKAVVALSSMQINTSCYTLLPKAKCC